VTPIRVAIADDQEMVRAGLRMIVEGEPDLVVVGEAGSGDEAVWLAQREGPDVVLMDVRMPGLDGIRATERILQDAAGSPTRVLMLTTFDLDEYVYHALRAGASGFLLKDVLGEDLVAAIRQVARGRDVLLAPSVTRRLVERFARQRPLANASSSGLEELTRRELEVLMEIARGGSNAEIAIQLNVSETTVKTHVARVLMKLGLRDRVQAVVAAYEAGLVEPGRQRNS
jgi:DNA-binding NarL/FixJ family response regulator